MRHHSLAAPLVLLALAAAPAVRAQAAPEQRPLVTVVGTAEIQVPPDLVDLRVGIETRDRDLGYAFRNQQDQVRQILDVAHRYGIEDTDVQTAYVSITPVYDDEKSGRRLSYYDLQKSIGITLQDPSKYDALLTDLLSAGLNTIDGITFRSSNEPAYKDKAREQAVESARQKASAMAAKLGQQIGKAFTIDEIAPPELTRPWIAGRFPGNRGDLAAEAKTAAPAPPTLALGRIVIRATVKVAFELR
jgi:uncharacterized protein YggE